MWGTAHEQRRSQSREDALKRRQKLNHSRIVKKHVFHKQKQELLQQLADNHTATPIVSTELGRPGGYDDSDDENDNISYKRNKRMQQGQQRHRKQQRKQHQQTSSEPGSEDDAEDSERKEHNLIVKNDSDGDGEIEKDVHRVHADPTEDQFEAEEQDKHDSGDDGSEREGQPQEQRQPATEAHNDDYPTKKGKYVPFAKQRKEFEELRKQREAERQRREAEIQERETFLKDSKQRRKRQVCLHSLFSIYLIYICSKQTNRKVSRFIVLTFVLDSNRNAFCHSENRRNSIVR